MQTKRYFILSILCAILILTACQNSAEPSSDPVEPASKVTEPEDLAPVSEREEKPEKELASSHSRRDQDWIEDIEFLREGIKTEHLNPFFVCPEEEFDWKLDQLEAKVSQLSDADIFYELKAVTAGLGDNHTSLNPPNDSANSAYDSVYSRFFPIQPLYIGDKLYLCGYLEGYEQFSSYLLHEIVAVNGIDIAYLNQKMKDVTNPYNSWLTKERFPYHYFIPSFLDWAGCDYQEGYTFQILNENQEVEPIEVPAIPIETAADGTWIFPENMDRRFFYRDGGGDWAEFMEGENGGCILLHFATLRDVATVIKIFDEAAALSAEHPDCSKLVIDLRDHTGGNLILALVREFSKKLAVPSIKQTYVVASGLTQSAGIGCLIVFQNVLDAVVIGEPTGQFTSFFDQKFWYFR